MGIFPLRWWWGLPSPGCQTGVVCYRGVPAKGDQSETPSPSFCALCLKLTDSGDGQVAFDRITNITPPGRQLGQGSPRPGDSPVFLRSLSSGIPRHSPS